MQLSTRADLLTHARGLADRKGPQPPQRRREDRGLGRGGEGAESDELTPLPSLLPAPGPSIPTGGEAEGQREPGSRSGSRGPQGAGRRAPGEGGLQTRAPPRGGLGVAVPETEVGQRAVPLSHGSQRLALPHGQTQAPGTPSLLAGPLQRPRARPPLAAPRAPGPAGPQRGARGSHPRPMLCLPDLGSPGNPTEDGPGRALLTLRPTQPPGRVPSSGTQNPWPRAAWAERGPESPPVLSPRPQVSAQPVLQVRLAPRQPARAQHLREGRMWGGWRTKAPWSLLGPRWGRDRPAKGLRTSLRGPRCPMDPLALPWGCPWAGAKSLARGGPGAAQRRGGVIGLFPQWDGVEGRGLGASERASADL